MEYDNQDNPVDDQGNLIVEGAFHRIKMRPGEFISPLPLLLRKVTSGRKLNIATMFYFENFRGKEVVREMFMDDNVSKYSQEELEGLVLDYKSLVSWIEQCTQSLPKCTSSVNSDGPKGTYRGFVPLSGALKR